MHACDQTTIGSVIWFNRFALIDDRIREIVRLNESIVIDNANRLTSCLMLATQEPSVNKTVELLWFSDCPNHPAARAMLEEVIADIAPGIRIRDVDATDPATAASVQFPGSPTIRVDGRDVDPGYVDPGDYTPRCRLYRTDAGLRGLPERNWIVDALRGATGDPSPDSRETG